MRHFFSISTLLVIHLSLSAQTATVISVPDTRNDNNAPNVYSREARFEFKSRSVIGVPGDGYYSGMLTFAPWGDYTGNKVHQLNFNDGGLFWRTGSQGSSWDGWRKILTETTTGSVGIGTTDPGSAILKLYKSELPSFELASSYTRLEIGMATCDWCYAAGAKNGDAVFRTLGGRHGMVFYMADDNNDGNSYIKFGDGKNLLWFSILNNRVVRIDGKVIASKIEVKTDVWSDYVFNPDYHLKSLNEVETYIKEEKHLPDVPSANQVIENGIDVAQMNTVLLKKIEEMTLHLIQLNKRIEALEKEKQEIKN